VASQWFYSIVASQWFYSILHILYNINFVCMHLNEEYLLEIIIFQLNSELKLNLKNAMESFQLFMESSQFNETSENQLYQHITDGLFSQFFPEGGNSVYFEEDVKFFVNYVNKEASLTQEFSSDDKNRGCISLSKLKFHLNKILCKGWANNEAPTAKPLNVFKLEVLSGFYIYRLSCCDKQISSIVLFYIMSCTVISKNIMWS